MKLRRRVVLCTMAIAVAGCASPVPVASNFAMSTQKVARMSHHWNVVADDVITQTLASIEKNPELQKRAVFVEQAYPGSVFDRAFRNFMITKLVEKGQFVNVCRSEPQAASGFVQPPGLPAVSVQYETQVVQHRGKVPHYRPGALTWLAANVAAIYNLSTVDHSSDFIGAGAAGLIIANDVLAGHVAAPTRTELILTTTITEDNRYVLRKSDIYYVPDADAALFIKQVAQHNPCPSAAKVAEMGEVPVSVDRRGMADAAEAGRYQMFVNAMRRANPEWRPYVDPSAEESIAYY